MTPNFSVSETFAHAWRYTKSQIWILAGLMVGYAILSTIINLFCTPLQGSTIGKVISVIISIFISSIFSLGYIKNLFQTIDGEEPQFSAYKEQLPKIINYVIATILYAVIVTIGVMLLILPGIYLAIRLQFYTQFIVENNAEAIESLRSSWQITEGETGSLLLLLLISIGVALLGTILFLVGLLVALPLIEMMLCCAFRALYAIKNSYKEE